MQQTLRQLAGVKRGSNIVGTSKEQSSVSCRLSQSPDPCGGVPLSGFVCCWLLAEDPVSGGG